MLRTFSRARELAERARAGGDYELAADIDACAFQLVAEADPVRLGVARAHLGISNPTARDWARRGILEPAGERPLRVSLASVARAAVHLHRLRAEGRADLARSLERHARFERSLQSEDFQRQLQRLRNARAPAPHGHRSTELASIARHRRIAEHLDERAVEAARARVEGWLRAGGPVSPRHAHAWRDLLARPIPEVRRMLVQDSELMRDLRQDSPFIGMLSDTERIDALLESR